MQAAQDQSKTRGELSRDSRDLHAARTGGRVPPALD